MGATFGVILVTVILLVAGVFMSPWFLIPAVLIVLFAVLAGPLGAMVRAGDGATGTPSTSEASYDPVSNPSERAV